MIALASYIDGCFNCVHTCREPEQSPCLLAAFFNKASTINEKKQFLELVEITLEGHFEHLLPASHVLIKPAEYLSSVISILERIPKIRKCLDNVLKMTHIILANFFNYADLITKLNQHITNLKEPIFSACTAMTQESTLPTERVLIYKVLHLYFNCDFIGVESGKLLQEAFYDFSKNHLGFFEFFSQNASRVKDGDFFDRIDGTTYDLLRLEYSRAHGRSGYFR